MAVGNACNGLGGVDSSLQDRVVHTIFSLVRRNVGVGAILNPRGVDWPANEARITGFWSSVLLMTGAYHGSPICVHLDIPDLTQAHFDLWRAQFVGAVCIPAQAALSKTRAKHIAAAFQFVRNALHPIDHLQSPG
jgi:hemoglobin